MLQAINDRIKGWLGIVIVVLIGLPFALWGIQSYFDDAGPRYAAKVNSTEISASEFERSVSMERQSMLRENGGKLPIEESVLRERTLSQLINQRLLEDVTFQNGYRISDTVLTERIRQLFSVDGVFDRDLFESRVASVGMNIPMYENALRNELRLQQMQSAITNTAFVTKEEINNLATLNEQTRDISVLTFNAEHFSTAAEPSVDEIKQYYEANLQRFMVPEKVKVDYVEITSEALAESVVVDEQQITKMYDDYVTSISGREERKASHILIQAAENDSAAEKAAMVKIALLKSELDSGADFAKLAKQNSQDTGSAPSGGDLGWVALGDMVKPFEQSLFDMEKGSVSDVVKTQFGYHLIKLDDVRSETVEPLAIKRYEFENELKIDEVSSAFYDLSERLASIAFENPDNLDQAVEELGLKINSSEYFSRMKGEGIAADTKVRNVAFSPLVLEQGNNSDIIELSPKHVVVLRINEHIPASAIPLEDVSAQIVNILKAQSGYKQTMAAAQAVKEKIEAGEAVDTLMADGIEIVKIAALGRRDKEKVKDPSILYNAFNMTAGQDDKPSVKAVELISGDVALLTLSKVNLPDTVSQAQLDQVKNESLRGNAIRDFSSALLAIKGNADINKNENLLKKN